MKRSIQSIPVSVTESTVAVPERLRELDRTQLHGVLATVSDNSPHTSLVAYALTPDARGIVFATPRKTTKYRNILKNKYISFLVDTRANAPEDYMAAETVSISGIARPLRKGRRREELAGLLLRKHPRLRGFVQSPLTALVHIEIIRCAHVSRFQSVSTWQP